MVLMSAALQWKPTGARYHLAFFVLLAPAAAVVLEAIPRKGFATAAMGILILTSIPYLLGNHSRPLISGWPEADFGSVLIVPRDDQYFANAPYLARPYRDVVRRIEQADCRQVGIALPGQGVEYPFWSLLGAPRSGVRIEWLVAGTAPAVHRSGLCPLRRHLRKVPGWLVHGPGPSRGLSLRIVPPVPGRTLSLSTPECTRLGHGLKMNRTRRLG
jgi:hypothetical protein